MNIKQILHEKIETFTQATLKNLGYNKELIKLDNEFGISQATKEFSKNLLELLDKAYKFSKNGKVAVMAEDRNDVKAIINSSMLAFPPNFKENEITDKNKNLLIKYLIENKNVIKLKSESKEKSKKIFRDEVNKAVDKIFIYSSLKNLVIDNLAKTYTNIIKIIGEEISSEILKQNQRSFKTNVEARVNELLSLPYLFDFSDYKISNTKGEGTYYIREPNGPGTFPDYRIYLGNDEVAKKIIKDFKIRSDIKTINVEGKKSGRVVGKQTSPEKMKKLLKDDELFNKLINIKGPGIKFNTDEVKKILKSLKVEFARPSFYINLSAKTPKAKIKEINMNAFPLENDVWVVKRASKGQIGFYNKGKKYAGIEIGSQAYGKDGTMEYKN